MSSFALPPHDDAPDHTVLEIAARDRVNVETVRDRISRGEYPGARKEGRAYRIPRGTRWTKPEAVDLAVRMSEAAAARAALRAWSAV